jgi:hypothetical protein
MVNNMFEWNNTINEIEKKKLLGLIPSFRQTTPKALGNLISDFIHKHAVLRADFDAEFDDEEDKFSSPDSANLYLASKSLIENGSLPENYRCDSSWESGGYTPYSDKDAREEHDAIVKLCGTMSLTK